MRLTRSQLEQLSSAEIEARIDHILEAHVPPDAYAEIAQLYSVLYERLHHEATLFGLGVGRLTRPERRKVLRRWIRRYALKERTVG